MCYPNDFVSFWDDAIFKFKLWMLTGASFYLPDTLRKFQFTPKEEMEEEHSLHAALEASKMAVIQGSMDALMVKINSLIDHFLYYHCSLLLFPLCKVCYHALLLLLFHLYVPSKQDCILWNLFHIFYSLFIPFEMLL